MQRLKLFFTTFFLTPQISLDDQYDCGLIFLDLNSTELINQILMNDANSYYIWSLSPPFTLYFKRHLNSKDEEETRYDLMWAHMHARNPMMDFSQKKKRGRSSSGHIEWVSGSRHPHVEKAWLQLQLPKTSKLQK